MVGTQMFNCTRYVGQFGLAKKHRRHCRRRYKYWSVPHMSAIVFKGTLEIPFRIHRKCAGFVVTLSDKLYSPAYSLSRGNICSLENPTNSTRWSCNLCGCFREQSCKHLIEHCVHNVLIQSPILKNGKYPSCSTTGV